MHMLRANVHFEQLANVQAAWVVAGFTACSLAQVAGCLRFHFTAARMRAPLSARAAFALGYIALLLNQILLFGMAGDAVRIARHGALLQQGSAGYGRALRVHAVDRMSGQVSVFLLFALTTPQWIARGSTPLAVGLFFALLLGFATVLRERVRHTLRSWFDEARAAMFVRGAPAVQLGLSSLVTAGCLGTYFCAARAVSVELSFAQLLSIGPLVLTAMSLPIGVGGWGPREAASAALFSASDLDPGKGLLVAVVYGVIGLIAALPALPLWLFSRTAIEGAAHV